MLFWLTLVPPPFGRTLRNSADSTAGNSKSSLPPGSIAFSASRSSAPRLSPCCPSAICAPPKIRKKTTRGHFLVHSVCNNTSRTILRHLCMWLALCSFSLHQHNRCSNCFTGRLIERVWLISRHGLADTAALVCPAAPAPRPAARAPPAAPQQTRQHSTQSAPPPPAAGNPLPPPSLKSPPLDP